MKTYFEIIENKTYRQLTNTQKEEIQTRQTELVVKYQDEINESKKEVIFDELYASLTGLIKGMSYRQAEKSFSVEKEDFEGIMYLVLVETLSNQQEGQSDLYGQELISFDRSRNKPFQPIFITNIKNVLKMMYRQKGYDVHETTLVETARLDSPSPEDQYVTMGDALEVETPFESDVQTDLFIEKALTDLFCEDDRKKTIVHMQLQGFKRNEIVSAVNNEGKSTDSIAKLVNRTWNEFKTYCVNLTGVKLA